MRDRDLREKFGKAGRKRAEENFSSSRITQKNQGALPIARQIEALRHLALTTRMWLCLARR